MPNEPETKTLVPSEPATPMSLIKLALGKGMAVENLGKLMDLQERHERNEAAKEFAVAIADFQAEMPAVLKGNPVNDKSGKLMYTFASHEDIMEIAQPILSKHGIAVTFDTEITPDKLMKTTCHVRVGIHVEHTTMALALPQIPNANDAQKAGGALSYGQRYAMKAALNIRITGEDKRDGADIVENLNEQQIQQINNLLEKRRAFETPPDFYRRFLKWLGVPDGGDLGDVMQSSYKKAVEELERQIKKCREEGAK